MGKPDRCNVRTDQDANGNVTRITVTVSASTFHGAWRFLTEAAKTLRDAELERCGKTLDGTDEP